MENRKTTCYGQFQQSLAWKMRNALLTNNTSFYEAFESGPQYPKLMGYITTILSISALLCHCWINDGALHHEPNGRKRYEVTISQRGQMGKFSFKATC